MQLPSKDLQGPFFLGATMGRIQKGGNVDFNYEYEQQLPNGDYVYPILQVVANVTDYDPGVLSGPPENCYPPEGGDVEDMVVTWPGERGVWDDPPQKLIDRLEEEAREQWSNPL